MNSIQRKIYIKNVAIYLRKSRGELDTDLDKHRLLLLDIVKTHNWNFVEYAEIGSGSNISERPKMLELLKDIKAGIFDGVLVMNYDRLSRGGGTDQDIIKYTFRDHDTYIIEGNPFKIIDPSSDSDTQDLTVKSFISELEYTNTTRRLQTGRKMALKMGRWTGTFAPYGYDYNPDLKSLVVNQNESDIVKLIYKNYLEGMSGEDITWKLNQMRIPSPKNTLWNPNSIFYILKNEVYIGNIVFNKTEGIRKKENTPISKKPFKKKPKDEWITVKNSHQSIITEEDFEKVQLLLKQKANRTGTGTKNSLSGLVKCFSCGDTLKIQKDETGDKLRNCRKCNVMGGDVSVVEATILTSIMALKNEMLKNRFVDNSSTEKETLLKEIKKLEKKIEVEELAMDKIEDAYEGGAYSLDKFKDKIKTRRDNIYELEGMIKRKRNQLESFKEMTDDERLKRIDYFIEKVKNNENPKELNKLYKSLISKIIFERTKNDSLKVTVNFL